MNSIFTTLLPPLFYIECTKNWTASTKPAIFSPYIYKCTKNWTASTKLPPKYRASSWNFREFLSFAKINFKFIFSLPITWYHFIGHFRNKL